MECTECGNRCITCTRCGKLYEGAIERAAGTQPDDPWLASMEPPNPYPFPVRLSSLRAPITGRSAEPEPAPFLGSIPAEESDGEFARQIQEMDCPIEGGKPSAETERARFEYWIDLYNLSFEHWQLAVTSPMGEACWAAWQAALSSQQPQGGEK